MPTSFRLPLALVLLALAASPGFAAKKNKANSLEDLLRPHRISNLTMSPDGKYAVGLAPIGKADAETGIALYDLDTLEIKHSFKWNPGYDIYRHRWLNDETFAFQVSKWGAYASGVYRLNVNRRNAEPLLRDDAVIEFVDANVDHPSESWIWIKNAWEMKPALVRFNKAGSAALDVRKQGLAEYTKNNPLILERIGHPPGDVFWWYIDHSSEPRIVSRFHDGKLEYLHRTSKNEDWTPLPLDPEEWRILIFHQDNRRLYVSGYGGHQTQGLYLYDIETDNFSDTLFRDEYYDFADTVQIVGFRDQLIGLRYQKDVPSQVWFSEEMQAIQNMVNAALPGHANIIYDFSRDLSRLLVYSYSDTTPPNYVLLDLKTKQLKEISKSAPWLDYSQLAKTEVFHFKTSDGLRLEGYLTRPTTGKAPYPTVALVHGGPWVRDTGTYDEEAQVLARQGYAVLKVNYRGSSGYGKKISEEPEFEFRKMHDDITEAVKMAVKAGIADESRLAIMGASFGGYAAMCGAAFEPDLYRCAITNMGVFDWEEMMRERKRQRSRFSYHKLREAFGESEDGNNPFEDISPIYHVDKVKIPVFIVHGKSDKNVPVRQSKSLKRALEQAGVEHESYFASWEGHHTFDMKKRVKLYEQVLAFLDKNMN